MFDFAFFQFVEDFADVVRKIPDETDVIVQRVVDFGGDAARRIFSLDDLFGVGDDDRRQRQRRIERRGEFFERGQRLDQHKDARRNLQFVLDDDVDAVLDRSGEVDRFYRDAGILHHHLVDFEFQFFAVFEEFFTAQRDQRM